MESHSDTLEPFPPTGRRMRMVSRDGLLQSLSTAVEETLREYSALPLAARMTLRREIQRRFVASLARARRVRGLTREEALREFERAHAALAQGHAETRQELERLEHRLAQRRDSAASSAYDPAALAHELEQDLAKLLQAPAATRDMALERVLERQAERQAQAVEHALAVERGKADILERRVAKMRGELAAMERALAELEHRAALDEGVASIYRDVQGLSAAEPARELKHDLMRQIFEANLALQHKASSPV